MKNWMGISTGFAAALLLVSGPALAQTQPSTPPAKCDKAATPSKVEGEVVKVDTAQSKVTVRGKDGTTHEFQASKDTMQDFKVGDRIEARLRSAPNC
jgi:hypothetical protein